MLVFIDESGDTGFKFDRGSSPYFGIVAVVFEDRSVASRCDNAIRDLRSTLGWHPRREFRFNNTDQEQRAAFFRQVAGFEFKYFGCVLNKRALARRDDRDKSGLYATALSRLFDAASPELHGATVVVDSTGDRDFRERFQPFLRSWLRASGRTDQVRGVRHERSHSDNLLQLADMIVGAAVRCFRSDLQDCREYWRMIRHREASLQLWPA